MTRKEVEARIEFETILQDETEHNATNGIVAATPEARSRRRSDALIAARLICRHGKTYARIQEAICNGPFLTRYQEAYMPQDQWRKIQANHEAWCEKREQQLEKRIRGIVEGLGAGFGVKFSGDPRGSTVKVIVPSGRTNDWGREGICVPTA